MRAAAIGVCMANLACGRLGFDTGPGGDAPGSDGAHDPITLVGSTTCQGSPTTLALPDGALVGDTLFVVFYMREPMPNRLPTIAGAGTTWQTDVAFSTVQSINRREISVFRTRVSSVVAPGTTVAIDFPSATSSGAALFRVGGDVQLTESATVGEGDGPAFAATHATTGQQVLCIVANHNSTSASFGPSWTTQLELTSNCGGTRETAQVHIATGAGNGNIDCHGLLGNSFGWAIAMVGYDGLSL